MIGKGIQNHNLGKRVFDIGNKSNLNSSPSHKE